MDSTSPLSPELHAAVLNSFAPVHIGSTVSVGLLGITILQAWLYYYNYPDDNLYTKLLVAVVCVVEFIRSSFTVHAAYYYLVLNWGNPDALNAIVWSLSLLLLMTKIVELMVHLYFAWRIWTLSRLLVVRWTLTAVVVTLTLWNCAMGIATYVISIESAGISAYATGAQKILSPFGLAVAILTDFTIMVSLIFLLNRGRSGLSRTNRIINTLIFYAIQAGMITVLADIVVIVLNHYIDRIGFEYLGVYSVVGNLYANSLLASLNARGSLRANDVSTTTVTTNRTWQAAFAPRNTDTTASLPHPNIVDNMRPKEEYHLGILSASGQVAAFGNESIEHTPVFKLGGDSESV